MFPNQLRPFLVDATRISDGKLVYIKEVKTGDQESRIASILAAVDDPANHSVPILDSFTDPADDSTSYIVMPFLRSSDSPPFETIGEVADFVDQLLEVRSDFPDQVFLKPAPADLFLGSRIHAFTRCCPSVRRVTPK